MFAHDEEPATAWEIAIEQGWDVPQGDDELELAARQTPEEAAADAAWLEAYNARQAALEAELAAAVAAGDLPW